MNYFRRGTSHAKMPRYHRRERL